MCAAYQAKAYDLLSEILNEEEMAVMKRGRNANGASVPKSSSPQEYRKATGVETLFGYLYLKGQQKRIQELFDIILEKID